MAFEYDYQCNHCRDKKTNKDLESFMCKCGGVYFLQRCALNSEPPQMFEYYDETLKKVIKSPQHRDREFKKAGLYVSQDDKKMMKRWKDARKYREDYVRDAFAKDGKNYKSGTKWSDKHQDFVPINYGR